MLAQEWCHIINYELRTTFLQQNRECLTLKANVFPVYAIPWTVQLAANQLLINGLEDTHVDRLAVVNRACVKKSKTHMCKRPNFCFWKHLRSFNYLCDV